MLFNCHTRAEKYFHSVEGKTRSKDLFTEARILKNYLLRNKVRFIHRLNMEGDLQSLFGLHVT